MSSVNAFYTLGLTCNCGEERYFQVRDFAGGLPPVREDALAQAADAGWQADIFDDTAICPACVAEQKKENQPHA